MTLRNQSSIACLFHSMYCHQQRPWWSFSYWLQMQNIYTWEYGETHKKQLFYTSKASTNTPFQTSTPILWATCRRKISGHASLGERLGLVEVKILLQQVTKSNESGPMHLVVLRWVRKHERDQNNPIERIIYRCHWNFFPIINVFAGHYMQ